MPSLQLLDSLPGHSDPAWSVSFNPSRPLLASCSTDKTVRLYTYTLPPTTDTPSTPFPTSSSAKPAFHLSTTIQTSHKRTVRSIAWAPSGRTLATASFDSTVGVWEEVNADLVDSEDVEGVFGSNEGEDRGEKEWECVTTLEGHDSECKGVRFSNDGGLLASCSRDKSVWVWEGE